MTRFLSLLTVSLLTLGSLYGQKKDLRYNLNDDGSQYIKATFLNQTWVRWTQNNPGTLVDGYLEDNTFDIGLRRTRIQLFGKISDRVFVYTQFGTNNLSYIGERKQGLFFHDAIGEIELAKGKLSVGTGLTGWVGFLRYSSPSIGSLLTMDAPLYQQATNDVSDQFVRKYSIYAKGKLGKLDYRIALSKPMSILASSVQSAIIGPNSLFSNEPANLQTQGYFKYEFLDSESNLTPYNTGSYLGSKNVFNIGAGFIFQKDAMWHTENNGADIVRENLALFGVDVFYDRVLDASKNTAITAYAAISSNDYGKNYVRNLGVMNPANGGGSSFNGSGNSFPINGTGTLSYFQLGYLLKNNLLGEMGTLQPYVASQIASLDLLNDTMTMYEFGMNWLIKGHATKVSLNYQSRPVFNFNNTNDLVSTDRRGMTVLQLQVSI
ncbi:hypothetical protein [Roseivirga spongicola]|uniref:hypothetical protein n=2 Tax=Roseivirga TaxID=290180 RepID=UPI002AC992B7|nr:hypothetical protein [Roseivirga spongicola]WPZ10160.1 hypothetical protein T7867_17990 [Roseivirga spongicola]